jgi:hypothetical protein
METVGSNIEENTNMQGLAGSSLAELIMREYQPRTPEEIARDRLMNILEKPRLSCPEARHIVAKSENRLY